MFLDRVVLQCRGGKGGNGTIAWRREKCLPKGGPYGGNGGRGGDIFLIGDSELFSLDLYRNWRIVAGQKGEAGGSNNRQGGSGKDLLLRVPCGTLVRDHHTKELLCDLTLPGEKFLLCQGGAGGKGNSFFKTSTHQAPQRATLGKEGEERSVELELKLLADIGLLGFPNAGKSTLFATLTAVPGVKTGAYPFTTLQPQLSYKEFEDFSRIYIADIPGILPDAHLDRGLGLSFLRHVERSAALLYVIDLAGAEGRDPWEDFLTLRREGEAYSSSIVEKPFLVALNKIDLEEGKEGLDKFCGHFFAIFGKEREAIFPISALTGEGIETLFSYMRRLVPIHF